jgi:FMN phosphatase YigB (HAD superfamily)
MLDAEESVFIDDNLSNVKSAQELGFNAILFDNFASVQKQLSELIAV